MLVPSGLFRAPLKSEPLESLEPEAAQPNIIQRVIGAIGRLLFGGGEEEIVGGGEKSASVCDDVPLCDGEGDFCKRIDGPWSYGNSYIWAQLGTPFRVDTDLLDSADIRLCYKHISFWNSKFAIKESTQSCDPGVFYTNIPPSNDYSISSWYNRNIVFDDSGWYKFCGYHEGIPNVEVEWVELKIERNPTERTSCCERTREDGWCEQVLESECDENYRFTFVSCEDTTYCHLGCCYDNQEGICSENTPKAICENSGYSWSYPIYGTTECGIPECVLGCCLFGDRAEIVTQVRCENLALEYGVEPNWDSEVDEADCVLEESCGDVSHGECKGYKYCSNGVLINNCNECGCPSGAICKGGRCEYEPVTRDDDSSV